MSVAVFRVKNFERFQHYKSKEGSPRWIKLYREILVDYEFSALPDDTKAHLMLIWVLASQTDKPLPFDPKWIASRIGATCKIDLDALVKAGFLILEQASESGLERIPESGLEQIREEEIRLEEKRQALVAVSDDRVSVSELVESWNEFAAKVGFAKVVEINPERQRKVKARLSEHPKVEFWSKVLTNIELSDFLCGRADRNGKHSNWRCNFDWLVSNSTVPVKIFEGGYNAQTQERSGRSSSGLQAAGMRG